MYTKGWFWDDTNKRMYRWHDLELLMKERKIKNEQSKSLRQRDEEISKQR